MFFYKWGYVRTTPPNNAGYPTLPMARIFFITSNFSRAIDGRRWKSKLTPGDCWGWDSLVPRRVDSLAGDLKFAPYMKSISRNLQLTWLLLRLGFLSNLHQELVSYKPTKRWYRMTMVFFCVSKLLALPKYSYTSKLFEFQRFKKNRFGSPLPMAGTAADQASTWKAKKCWPPEVGEMIGSWWCFCWENQWLPNVANGCWSFPYYIYIYLLHHFPSVISI